MYILFLGVALLITAMAFGWFLAQELRPKVQASSLPAPVAAPTPAPLPVATPVRRPIRIKPYQPEAVAPAAMTEAVPMPASSPETITLTLIRKPTPVAAALEPPESIDYDGPPAAVEAIESHEPVEPAAPPRPRWSGPGRRFKPRAFAPKPPPQPLPPPVESPMVSVGLNLGSTHLTWALQGGDHERLLALVAFPTEGPPVLGEAARAHLDTDVVCQPFHRNLYAGSKRPSEKRDLRALATDLLLDDVMNRVRAVCGDGPLRLALAAAPGLLRQFDPLVIEACRARCEVLATMGEAWAIARAEEATRAALVITIGALNTELTAVLAREPQPADSSIVRCGGADIDAKLVDLLKDRAEAPRVEAETARRLKEAHGRIRSRAGGVLVKLPIPGGEAEMDIGDEVQRACGQILVGLRPALRRVIEQLGPQERLAIKDQVILAGGSALIEGLCEALQPVLRELSAGSARRAQDPQGAAARGALAIAQAMPERRWQEALSAA